MVWYAERLLTERNSKFLASLNLLFSSRLIDTDAEATVVNIGIKIAAVVYGALRAILILMAASSNDLEDLAHKGAVGAIEIVYPGTIKKINLNLAACQSKNHGWLRSNRSALTGTQIGQAT